MNKIGQKLTPADAEEATGADLALPGDVPRVGKPSSQSATTPLFASFRWPDLALVAGLLALALPTMLFVARSTWSEEQGAHGPMILATGLWLLWHNWHEVRGLIQPPPAWRVAVLWAFLIPIYLFTRVTQIVELEGYAMYALLIATFYGVVGWPVIKALAFPIAYLAFAFPPPETIIYSMTLPVKMAITDASIALLSAFGYPIGGTGVTIQIGQYQLLVAAACSGLNSIVSLSAISLFYIYLMHREQQRMQLLLLLFVIPVAVAANFIRVMILILLTYHAGEAAAQGFLHDAAGLTMFISALMLIFLIDKALSRFIGRRREKRGAVEAIA